MPNQSITVPLKATRLTGEPVEFSDIGTKDEKPKFKMNAYSGDVIPNHWFWGNLIIDIAGIKLPKKKMPVLQDHFTEKIVGWSEKIKKGDDGVLIEGNFAESTQSGQEAMALAKEGFPWQASVYIPPSSIEDVSEGTKVEVNGRKLKGPLTIFRKTELKEASFCALGADSNTSAEALKDSGNIQVPITNTKKGGNKQMDELTMEILKKDHGDLVVALSAEVSKGITIDNFPEDVAKLKEEASKVASKAERERILGIFGQAYGEDMKAKFEKIVGPDANMEALMAFAQEKAKQDILAKMTAEAPESAGAGDGDEGNLSKLTGEEKWKAEFAESKDLQDEFGGSVDRYLAFKKAEGEGKVRILKSKQA